VRSPLARRIPGNDRLNAVDCLLPKFSKKTVEAVVDALMTGDESSAPSGRILIDYVEVKPHPDAPIAVWDAFEALPSQTRPQRGAKPAKRLTALAHELASDDILQHAGKLAHAEMHKALDAFQESQKEKIEAKRKSVMTVDGKTVIAEMKGKTKTFDEFWEDADVAVIDDAYRRAARIFSPAIAHTYVEHLAQKVASVDDDPEEYLEAIVEARVTVAGLGLVTEVQAYFDAKADELAKAWLATYAFEIKTLSDDRKETYRQIVEMSTVPQSVDLAKPESRYEATKARENGKEVAFPTWKNHLLSDKDGKYPAELNDWERTVVEAESKREGFRFWYRNPQQPGQSSLGIAYINDEQYKVVRPDFIFFAEQNSKFTVDLVDPHGLHLADALPKLQGLAIYAEFHASAYRRIESVAEASGKLRVLDLTRAEVRTAIKEAKGAKGLFEGTLASDYE
jgi:type III restriction enzyme